MTSNTDYTLQNKKERFMKCFSSEINDTSVTSKHFLNVLGDKNVSKLMERACPFSCPLRDEMCLEIKGYPTMRGTYRVPCNTIDRSQRKNFLLAAIRAWFDDYDPEIAYEVGDFTSAVWFRYKQAIRHVLAATSLRKRAEMIEKIARKATKHDPTAKIDKLSVIIKMKAYVDYKRR